MFRPGKEYLFRAILLLACAVGFPIFFIIIAIVHSDKLKIGTAIGMGLFAFFTFVIVAALNYSYYEKYQDEINEKNRRISELEKKLNKDKNKDNSNIFKEHE